MSRMLDSSPRMNKYNRKLTNILSGIVGNSQYLPQDPLYLHLTICKISRNDTTYGLLSCWYNHYWRSTRCLVLSSGFKTWTLTLNFLPACTCSYLESSRCNTDNCHYQIYSRKTDPIPTQPTSFLSFNSIHCHLEPFHSSSVRKNR